MSSIVAEKSGNAALRDNAESNDFIQSFSRMSSRISSRTSKGLRKNRSNNDAKAAFKNRLKVRVKAAIRIQSIYKMHKERETINYKRQTSLKKAEVIPAPNLCENPSVDGEAHMITSVDERAQVIPSVDEKAQAKKEAYERAQRPVAQKRVVEEQSEIDLGHEAEPITAIEIPQSDDSAQRIASAQRMSTVDQARMSQQRADAKLNEFNLFGCCNDKYEEAGDFYKSAAKLYIRSKNYKDAGKCFEDAAEAYTLGGQENNIAEAYRQAAVVYQKAGATRTSITCYEIAIVGYSLKGNWSTAAKLLEEKAKLSPNL